MHEGGSSAECRDVVFEVACRNHLAFMSRHRGFRAECVQRAVLGSEGLAYAVAALCGKKSSGGERAFACWRAALGGLPSRPFVVWWAAGTILRDSRLAEETLEAANALRRELGVSSLVLMESAVTGSHVVQHLRVSGHACAHFGNPASRAGLHYIRGQLRSYKPALLLDLCHDRRCERLEPHVSVVHLGWV